MSKSYTLTAEVRAMQGKGASRRLRKQDLVPAVIYGAGKPAQSITLRHNEMARNLQDEAFYTQIITVDFGSHQEQAILRDLQRHPAKPLIMHVDLLRISEDHEIRVHVPLHFVNEDISKGVKEQGAAISHVMTEVEIACLPKHLPEYIEVDMSQIEKGQIVHLSDLKLPEGVSIPALALGADHNAAVASCH